MLAMTFICATHCTFVYMFVCVIVYVKATRHVRIEFIEEALT